MNGFIKTLLWIGLLGGIAAGAAGVTYGANKTAHDFVQNAIQGPNDDSQDTIRARFLYNAKDFVTMKKADGTVSLICNLEVYRNGKIDDKTGVFLNLMSTKRDGGWSNLAFQFRADHQDPTIGFNNPRYFSGAKITIDVVDSNSAADNVGCFDCTAFILKENTMHKVGETFIPYEFSEYVAPTTTTSTSGVQPKLGLSVPRILMAATAHTFEITATLAPADATLKTILWSSADPAKVSVSATKSESGTAVTLTGLATFEGTIAVTAKYAADYSISAVCLVSYPAAA